PLRERRDEIALLVAYFGDEAAGALKRRPIKLTPRLRDFLMNYAYPGNIRELRNLMYRTSCLAGDTADLEHLPQDLRPKPSAPALVASGGGAPVVVDASTATSLSEAKRAASDEAERAFIERGLQEVGGTVAELARRFDMNRSHLQMLLKKHGIHSKDFRNQGAAQGGKAR
ncbi:response regulator, partial [Cupriavidus basilensis OR16]